MSGNGQSLSFTYNADGIRTSKTVNGVTRFYHLAGTQILSEEWTDAEDVQHLIVYHYDASGQPVGMSYRNSTYYEYSYDSFLFVKNLQGDIIKVLDNHGDLLVSYTYDAWGVCFTTNHNVSGTNRYATYNPFRYRGYYFDTETGFYYLNSRYYNPSIGRFINADTLVSTGQGILGYNMFAYCRNKPVSRKDSLGTDDVCATNFDDDGNPLNDLAGGPSGGGCGGGLWGCSDFPCTTYHYCVDFSIAERSSITNGGIYHCGYTTYSYTAGPSFSSASGTGGLPNTNTQKFIPNPNGRKGGAAHQTTIANEVAKYPSPQYKVAKEVCIRTPNGIKPYRFADIAITDNMNGKTTYINVGKKLLSGEPCAREARALADIRGIGAKI